ncbi:hypothetical protein AM493_07930 [Flavobacterium akiainvivens]|uniref:Uncharacterized protein n=1 Tax=Flavobacterium akiainvivens TaxID=1202724 RepID=A0A0N0RQQ0_9FLAO|nr:hypothetical protein [Flavobacterium akiainvivens]KOS05972.1 hypothetical protein AM493_07930 [Flavobacterium akiainvivens]SFQ53791.1 hypothetical protein SAMN05444144_10767 [Flavobacterium akiainvivens]
MAPLNKNVMPDEHNDSNANPEFRERTHNWDNNAQMSPEVGKAYIQNERRNLNADQEKRNGNSNPDRDRRR